MHETRVTIRYAKALFELAREENELARIEQDLKRLDQAVAGSAELRNLLFSPTIQSAEKWRVLQSLFLKELHPVTLRFLQLLTEKNREGLLAFIIRRFMQLLDEYRGILRGQLITAYPFAKQQLATLKKKLDERTGKDVHLEERIDPDLLGGFIIRLNDTVIDTSIRNQLQKMRSRLVSGV